MTTAVDAKHHAPFGSDRPFFESNYVSFCAPLHALDVTLMWLGFESQCETFTIVARKPHCAANHEPARDIAQAA